jgi:hypothetical protein
MDKQIDCPGVLRAGAIPPHPPLLVCEPLAGLICLPRGDDREPRREGRRFSSSTHEMRQPDAANKLERWSGGCGLFESRRRSLGAMGLGEPWVSHQAAAAETDQCGDRWGGGGLLPACGYEQPRQTATHPNRTGPAPGKAPPCHGARGELPLFIAAHCAIGATFIWISRPMKPNMRDMWPLS